MQLKSLSLVALSFSALSILSCGNNTDNPSEDKNHDTATAAANTAQSALTITPVGNSPEFNDAALAVKDVKAVMKGTDSVSITVNYDVRNFQLKNQTTDAATKGCNNSKDGQHIHFILDNEPYIALYEPSKTFTVAVNSEHYLMSFLSRSYHESVKTPGAGVLYHFSVDGKGKLTKMAAPESPMIFYSRPKGDYLGEDTKKVLLDFYVYNAKLGDDAKVKADINGTVFDIDQWQPYFIENAPMGDLKVTLQLTGKDGKALEGANTRVSRTSRLAQQEPMQ